MVNCWRKKEQIRRAAEAGPKTGPKPQLEALLINPAEGQSYADVLRNLRSKIKSGVAEAKIKAVRKSRKLVSTIQLRTGSCLIDFKTGDN